MVVLPWRQTEWVALGRTGPLGWRRYRLPLAARHTHLYVIGTTGSGKSKFLEHLIIQDILAGRGCGLVDPHTDLARDVLAHLGSVGFFGRPGADQQVIYFDPTRTDAVMPFNVLRSPLPAYTIAQMVIEAFRRTWPESLAEAPRFTNIALAALLVLIETDQTLVQMPLLLTDRAFREQLLGRIEDGQLVEFFHSRFDQWGRDTAVMIESVLNKVTAFTLNPHLKRILGTAENRLDFRRIMDGGQTLIVDLGRCDGETRRLVGSLVVTGLEQAALTRKDDTRRRGFYLYLDEFQDFCANDGAAKTLSQILSECRKFGLYLHLAHQTLGQLHQRISTALGNVGVKVAFGVDREDAEVLARKLFAVNPEEVKHEAQTDTQHPVYAPLPEQWEQWVANVQNLRPRWAWVKPRGRPPVRIKTEAIAPYRVTVKQIGRLQTRLAATHGMPVELLTPAKTAAVAPAPEVVKPLQDWEPLAATGKTGGLLFGVGGVGEGEQVYLGDMQSAP